MTRFKQFIKRMIRRLGFDIRRMPAEHQPSPVLPMPDILYRFHYEDSFRHILDIGANEGQTAKTYATWFPKAVIHSIEPYSEAFQKLREVTDHYPNVSTYCLAFGEENAEKELFVNAASATNSLLPAAFGIETLLNSSGCNNQGRESVSVRTLTDFCNAQGIERVDLLKIDAQGYEDRILRGAGDWLTPERIRLVYLEVLFIEHYEGQAQFDEVCGIMRGRGYKLYALYDTCESQEKGYMWSNALFVPRPT